MKNRETSTMDKTEEKAQPATRRPAERKGRSRGKRIVRAVAAAAVVGVLSAGGYFGWHAWNGANDAAA